MPRTLGRPHAWYWAAVISTPQRPSPPPSLRENWIFVRSTGKWTRQVPRVQQMRSQRIPLGGHGGGGCSRRGGWGCCGGVSGTAGVTDHPKGALPQAPSAPGRSAAPPPQVAVQRGLAFQRPPNQDLPEAHVLPPVLQSPESLAFSFSGNPRGYGARQRTPNTRRSIARHTPEPTAKQPSPSRRAWEGGGGRRDWPSEANRRRWALPRPRRPRTPPPDRRAPAAGPGTALGLWGSRMSGHGRAWARDRSPRTRAGLLVRRRLQVITAQSRAEGGG